MKNMYENSIPKGYHNVTPSINVRGAAAAIEFYERIFGAVVRTRMDGPTGLVMHSELEFGNSVVMVNDEFPDWGVLSPLSIGGSAGTLMLYVADVDVVYNQAVAAGAEVIQPLADQFWGDRMGKIKDPFGHLWSLATRVEQLSEEEVEKRSAEFLKKGEC